MKNIMGPINSNEDQVTPGAFLLINNNNNNGELIAHSQ